MRSSPSFRFVALLFAALTAIHGASAQQGGELTLCENGNSRYRIVLPDQGGAERKHIEFYLAQCAETLRECIRESTGADLPVVHEEELTAETPGIFLGATRKALAAGIDPTTMRGYHCVMKTAGRDILLVGGDRQGRDVQNAALHRLGTVKAVALFLKRLLGVEFVMPGEDGMIVPKADRLLVPKNLDVVYEPTFEFCTSRHREMMYDIANNFHPANHYAQYGGHSHPKAIPVETFGATHPEYFRLWKGRRVADPNRPLYCLSNPEVQELIYRELLTHIDQDPDTDVVQLAQSDGYIPCQCEQCAPLYGLRSSLIPATREWIQDPVWGQKLWIMHRQMAERFLKDRPGKRITLSYYGPTKNLPEDLTSLPPNALVDMSYYEEEDFEKWRAIDVPAGFYVTLKNWGKYRAEGYTPKRDPDYIVDQVRRFHNNRVKGIYRMGFGELFGLEGPVYYLFGKLLEEPDADPNEVLESYYRLAYGEARGPMRKFFDLLHERLKQVRSLPEDWNDDDLLAGSRPATGKQMRLLQLRFPPDVLARLELYLSEAEKIVSLDARESKRRQVTRIEFDYLKDLATVFNQFAAYLEEPTEERYRTLAASVKERTETIEALPRTRGDFIAPVGSIPLFGKSTREQLLHGWGKNSYLKEPFNWDFDEHPTHSVKSSSLEPSEIPNRNRRRPRTT